MIRFQREMSQDIQENVRGGQGKVQFQHLFTQEEMGSPTRLFAKITLPPGSSIGFHEHHDEEEVYYILQGKGKVIDADVEEIVGPGDAVLTGGGKGHSLENIGTQPLEIIAVVILFT